MQNLIIFLSIMVMNIGCESLSSSSDSSPCMMSEFESELHLAIIRGEIKSSNSMLASLKIGKKIMHWPNRPNPTADSILTAEKIRLIKNFNQDLGTIRKKIQNLNSFCVKIIEYRKKEIQLYTDGHINLDTDNVFDQLIIEIDHGLYRITNILKIEDKYYLISNSRVILLEV